MPDKEVGEIRINKIGKRLINIPARFMRFGGTAVITGGAMEPQDWSEFSGIGEKYSLEFQNTQDEIPAGAFEHDENLRSIIAPSAEKIGKRAFRYCFSLETARFQEVREIDKAAFYRCQSLENICFENAERICSQAFAECGLLEAAVFPKARYIGVMAFDACQAMRLVRIPRVGSKRMFAYSGIIGCEHLESIEIGGENPRFTEIKALLETKGVERLLNARRLE